jgi:hypothetical protein
MLMLYTKCCVFYSSGVLVIDIKQKIMYKKTEQQPCCCYAVKVKLSPQEPVSAHRVVRRQGFCFLDKWLTYGGEVSLTRRQRFNPQEDSWYSFLFDAESTPGPSAASRITQTEKFQWPHPEPSPRPSGLVA